MNPALATPSGPPTQTKKVVYFATGAPAEVAADLERLKLRRNGTRLRVVVPAPLGKQVEELASLTPEEVLPFRPRTAPLVWLRLWGFLGLSRGAQIICLSSRPRFRFLKFLALTLRGRASFSSGNGTSVSCGVPRLLWYWLARKWAAQGPICLLASASPDSVSAIAQSLRQRYPGVPIHGVFPTALSNLLGDQFDSCAWLQRPLPRAYLRLLPRCLGRRRFRRVVVPWSDEPGAALRWLAWFLPLWHIEIYNDNLDVFSGRNLGLLIRHGVWRHRQKRERRLETLPVGVIGSASGYYLEKIVVAVRSRFPGVPVDALLLRASAEPAEGLFDSVRVVEPGFRAALREGFRLARAQRAYQCWIVPCTDEPYYFLKCMAVCWPLRRRWIFNELADGFAARDRRSVWKHFRWRLRDHLSYQIVAGAVGKGMSRRFLQLFLYGFRLLGAVPLLCSARLRSYRARRSGQPAGAAANKPLADVALLSSEGNSNDLRARYRWNGSGRAPARPRDREHPLRSLGQRKPL